MKAKIRKISLLCELDNNIPNSFITDPKLFKRIVINLIGNAMKFTFKGYVKLKAIMLKQDEANTEQKDAIKIIIEDTGVGIKEKDQKSLFQLFSVG